MLRRAAALAASAATRAPLLVAQAASARLVQSASGLAAAVAHAPRLAAARAPAPRVPPACALASAAAAPPRPRRRASTGAALEGEAAAANAAPGGGGVVGQQQQQQGAGSRMQPEASTLERRGVFLVECRDRSGIIRAVSDRIEAHGGTIRHIDLHCEQGHFWGRIEFCYDCSQWSADSIRADFLQSPRGVVAQLPAVKTSLLMLYEADDEPERRLPMALLVSKQDHCLVDFLYRWQSGELPVDLRCVVSNHPVDPHSHVGRFLDRHGVPLHILPCESRFSNESAVLEAVQGTELLVLARYMQVLSGDFLKTYGRDIINIHHGLLPSFKGAAPYRQAHRAGVKIIGATAHFVTDHLDEGPIIKQLVEPVSHRDSLQSLARKSKGLEQRCLADAVRLYVEGRVVKGPENRVIVLE